MKSFKELKILTESTWEQDFKSGNIDQIIKRTKKILHAQFQGKALSKSDAQYWHDYVRGVGRGKPMPKL